MATKFNPSYSGIGQMLRSPQMEALMRSAAEKAKPRAEAIAPVDVQGPHPGRYKESFSVSSGVKRGKTRRAYGRLTNSSPEAVFVEYGTENNPAHHTLMRSIGAVGE